MTHQEVQQGDFVERYVRHQLTADERRAFQEHYFACAECFEEVQTTARFIVGVKQAARQGVLAEHAAQPWWAALFQPALGFAVATALVLAVAFGWLMWKQNSAPRERVAVAPAPTPTAQSTATPEATQTATPTSEHLKPQHPPELLAQNRAPSVFLDAARDAGAASNQLTLPANATNAILRIEIEPNSSYTGFQFQVFDSARRLVTTGTGGKPSARGTVTANLSASSLQSGKYLVKCFGLRDGQRLFVGEYDLQVRRQ